jgi:hypothetical protein
VDIKPFTHVVKNFIRPKVAKRDVDPKKDVAEYDYSKRSSAWNGNGLQRETMPIYSRR